MLKRKPKKPSLPQVVLTPDAKLALDQTHERTGLQKKHITQICLQEHGPKIKIVET